jgi:hypothetical protein
MVAIAALSYSAYLTLRYRNVMRVGVIAEDLRVALPGYRRHVQIIGRFRDLVEAERRRTGQYPVSQGMQPLAKVFEAHPHFGRAADFATQFGGVVYISDGHEYKILLQETRDCFVARIMNPDMLDPRRSIGVGDCVLYGYWSAGGGHM